MLDKAEDPGQTLDYSYQQQLEMLQKVKRGVADVVTAKKRLQLQTAKLEESVVKLDGQARQALAGNREDLARTALERKALIQGQLQGLDTQITALEQQQQNLIDQERRLSAKVESFRTQKEVMKAQYSAAEAQVRIGEATTGLGEEMSDVGLALQRAQDKTEQMQARAAAVERARRHGRHRRPVGTGDVGPRHADRGHVRGSQVESEMARLRAEIEAPTPAPKLTEGRRGRAGAAVPATARRGGTAGRLTFGGCGNRKRRRAVDEEYLQWHTGLRFERPEVKYRPFVRATSPASGATRPSCTTDRADAAVAASEFLDALREGRRRTSHTTTCRTRTPITRHSPERLMANTCSL